MANGKDHELFGEVNINIGGIQQATNDIAKSFKDIEKAVEKTGETIEDFGKKTKDNLDGVSSGTGVVSDSQKKVAKSTKTAWTKYYKELEAVRKQDVEKAYALREQELAKERELQAKQSSLAIDSSNSYFARKKDETQKLVDYYSTTINGIMQRSKTKTDTFAQSFSSIMTQIKRLDSAYGKAIKKDPTSLTSGDASLIQNYRTIHQKLVKLSSFFADKMVKAQNDANEKAANKSIAEQKRADKAKIKSAQDAQLAKEKLIEKELAKEAKLGEKRQSKYASGVIKDQENQVKAEQARIRKAEAESRSKRKADEKAYADYTKRQYKETTDSIVNEYKKHEITGAQAINKLKEQLRTLQPAYDKVAKKQTALSPKEKSIINSYNNIKKSIVGIETELAGADHKQKSFLQNAMKWSFAYKLINGVWQSFKDGLKTLNEVDDALVNIRKVTDMTAKEGQVLAQNAAAEVAAYGRTVQDYLSAYEMFAKAGFRDQTLDDLSKLSLLLQNVGDITAEVANKTLIAANAGFKLGGNYEKLTHIIDVMNNISNNNAVTVEKMSEAITVSASVAQFAGFSFDEYMAIIGSTAAVTQREGSEIGRAMRTIVANIMQVADAEAEVDEDTFAKSGKALKRIADIDLTDTSGNMRDVMDILTELAGKWSGLNDLQQTELANTIGNKRQIDIFLGMMNNWTVVEKQLGEAVDSTGSALQENETYLDSITAKTNEFKNAVTKLWLDTIQTDVIKAVVNFATGIIKVVDAIGVGKLAIVVFTGILVGSVIPAILSTIVAIKAAIVAGKGLISVLAVSPWGLAAIAISAVVAGIMYLTSASGDATNQLDKMLETIQALKSEFDQEGTEVSGYADSFKELYDKQEKTLDETLKLADASAKLNGVFKQYGVVAYTAEDGTKQFGLAQEFVGDTVAYTNIKIGEQITSYEDLNLALKAVTESRLLMLKAQYVQLNEESEKLLNNNEQLTTSFDSVKKSFTNWWTGQSTDGISNIFAYYADPIDRAEEIQGQFEEQIKASLARAGVSYEGFFDSTLTAYQKMQAAINTNKLNSTDDKWLYDLYATLRVEVEKAISVQAEYQSIISQLEEINKRLSTSNNEVAVSFETIATVAKDIDSLGDSLNNVVDKVDMLNGVMTDLRDEKELTLDQITDLITAYPELSNYVDKATGAFNIQIDALEALKSVYLEEAKTTATTAATKLKAVALASASIVSVYAKEVEALKVLSSAQVESAKSAQYNAKMGELLALGLSPQQAHQYAADAANALADDLNEYNKAAGDLALIQAQINKLSSGGKATPSKSSKTSTDKEKAYLDSIEAKYKLIRDTIEDIYGDGKITALQALAKINNELNSIKGTYDKIKAKAENTWSDLEKALVGHYEDMLNLQEKYASQVEQDYDDAVSGVETLQSRVVDALRLQYEKQKQLALDAIEKQREAENDAFDERIKELEAEKAAIEDTRAEDEANLDTLKAKLELAKLDDSVYGKKRQAELEAEVRDLEKKLAIADIDAEIAQIETDKDARNTYYDDQVTATTTMYDQMLEDAKVYAEANRLILEGHMDDIVALLETYAPDFSGIGQMLGKSMADEIKAEVQSALNDITTVTTGTTPPVDTSAPQSPTVTGGSSSTSLAWDGKVYRRGSTGDTVKRIQKNLIAKGFSVGSSGADGRFGGATEDAVEAFQKKFSLGIDGIVGSKTWKELIAFASGGIPQFNSSANGGVVYAHAKERILSAAQTKTFDEFVYTFLPRLTKFLHSFDGTNTGMPTADVDVNVEMNNYITSKFDEDNMIDNFNRVVKKTLIAQGIKG